MEMLDSGGQTQGAPEDARRVVDAGPDPLTGLIRMREFLSVADARRKVGRDEQAGGELAMLFFNLINFRSINLHYGLASGDELLRRMADALVASFPQDVVAHFDGDRFAVLTTTVRLEERATAAREKIDKLVPNSIRCSVGGCVWSDHQLTSERVAGRARLAADENLNHDNTFFSLYTPEAGGRAETADYVLSHLDEAIEKGWIEVYYQPVIRTLSNQICGMEALARWNDPVRGMLMPADFIAPLEEAQLVWKLDLCVIRQVVSLIAEHYSRSMPEIPVSINLSRTDFFCCDIYNEIEKLVQAYDVPRRMLHIEVTESIMTSRETPVLRALERFRRAGYELWMDDFGSGYSTLNLLKDCSFDLLKLDMGFLHSDSARSREIIAAVIAMDKRIGNRTLAEGVETEDQVEFLTKCGCEKMQGYYFGKPQPFDEMLKSCLKRWRGIETPRQKACYDALSTVDFMTDIPLAIAEIRGNVSRVLFMNDPALELAHRDGFTSVRELEDNLNDPHSVTSLELLRASKSAMEFGRSGEFSTPFGGRELLLRYRLLGKYHDVGLLVFRIYERGGYESALGDEKLSLKSQLMMNVFYYYNHVFSIDPQRQTIQDVRVSGASQEWGTAAPLQDDKGQLSSMLPAVFAADQQRYHAFLDPETLASRLRQSERGTIQDAFRTRDMDGTFVWMSHRLLLAPNTGGKQILYVIRTADTGAGEAQLAAASENLYRATGQTRGGEGVLDAAAARKAPCATLMDSGPSSQQQAFEKAKLWDDLLLHIPLPMFWKDTERRFIGANQYFLDVYGLASVDEIIGKTDEDMGWHPENEPYRLVEERVLKTGKVCKSIPGRCIIKGVTHDIYATKWPIYRDGRIAGLMGYFFENACLPQGSQADGSINLIGLPSNCKTASRFMDDLFDFEIDHQLNKRNFGVLQIWIPELTRIADNFGHEAMHAVTCACHQAITEEIGNVGALSFLGIGRFGIVEQYVSIEELQDQARRIREGINAIREVGGLPCSLYAKVTVLGTDDVLRTRNQIMQLLFGPQNAAKARWSDREAAEGVAEYNQVLQTVMESVPIGCYILKPNHMVMYWNRRAGELLGFSASEMQGKKCVDMPLGCSFATGGDILHASCPATVAFITGQPQTTQMFMRQKSGKNLLIRNTLVPIKDSDGKVVELVSFFVPLTEESYDQHLVNSIYEVATRDPLTCLPGRRYMESRIDEELEVFGRTKRPFAMLFADVDNLHDINNTYGHDAGDAIIRKLGLALRVYGRKTDRFCRWGGDEFVGLLQLRSPEDIKGAAKRFMGLANACEEEVNGKTVACQLAIGITVVREGDNLESLLSRADGYMYRAKKLNANQVVTDFDIDG